MIKDICIIGAGPVGIFTAFYAGMRKMSTVVVDQLEIPGGQLSALYPEKFIYDVAGYKEIRAQELVDQLLGQLDHFPDNTTFELNQQVIKIDRDADNIFTITTNLKEFKAKSVIIAGGNGGFKPRPLGVEGEEKFNNIHYLVKDLKAFTGKKVAVFGGGDSAVD